MSRKIIQLTFSILLLAGMAFGFAIKDGVLANSLQTEPNGKIEGMLQDKFATEGTADFIVTFTEKADLSLAYKMDWDARGHFVYDTLTATAQRIQAQAKIKMDGFGIRYQTFIAGNELYVYGGNIEAANSVAALPEVNSVLATRVYHVDPNIQSTTAIQSARWAGDLLANHTESPVDAPSTLDWGITDTAADQFWGAFGIQGTGIVVANIDTGVDYTHVALDQNYKCAADPSDPACWLDPTNDCPSDVPCDAWPGVYHGTHTMGTMVGDDDPSLQYQVGMAPDAQWIACLGCPSGGCPDVNLFACADWILAPGGNSDNRPNVVNNSWGGGGGNTWYQGAVQSWVAAGVFPAFSAGNNYSCNSLGSPGDYQESFASAAHRSDRVIADFSSKGPSAFGDDPYTKPNISAPGEDIMSAMPGNTWQLMSGTSMASPHTAGAVALLWSCNPSLVGQIDQTFQILQDNSDASPEGSCGAPGNGEGNYTYGYGYLNVLNAGFLWCGETGAIDGHVYDAITDEPIEATTVHASSEFGGGPTDFTDPTGYYSMTATAGTYTITAVALGYEMETVTDVSVITDLVTTQDFNLIPQGTLLGFVTDFDNGFPLVGATVTANDGSTTTTVDDGSYELYLDQGTYTITASMQDYAPETVDVDIVSGLNTEQNFALQAAIVFTPSPLHVTLDLGDVYNTGASILNRLPLDYAFEFLEKDEGNIPLGGGQPEYELVPSIPGYVTTGLVPDGYVPSPGVSSGAPQGLWQGLASTPFATMDNPYVDYEGMGYLVGGYGAAGQVGIYNPVTNSWTTGSIEPAPQIQYPVDGCVGQNANGEGVVVLINDTTSGVSTFHRYNITTNVWDTPEVPVGFPSNGLWGQNTVSLLSITGNNICYISGGATTPGGGNTSTLYAYYPDINTIANLGDFNYLSGGFDFHASWYVPWIGGSGAICVGGGTNASSSVSDGTQCYDIGAGVFNTANADLGALPSGLWGTASGFLYEDGDYQLWVANGADAGFALWPNSAYFSESDSAWHIGPPPSTIVYRVGGTNIISEDGCSFYVAAGSTGGFSPSTGHNRNYSADCPPIKGGGVPWLSEVPVSGTVPAGDTLPVSIYFTATQEVGVNQPGDYLATLKVNGDPKVNVPVIMTVLPPSTWGKLAGTITDQCTDATVEEALIEITGGDPITQTMSDENGYYVAWIEQGTYTVNFSAPGYVGTSGEYVVLPGQTTNGDVILVPDRPCVKVEPDMIEVWVLTDTQAYTSGGLQITNPGTQPLTWEASERDEGYSPLGLNSYNTVTIPAGPEVAPAGSAVASGPYRANPSVNINIPKVPSAGGPHVLLVCSDNPPLCEPIRAQLQAFGDFEVVDAFDAQIATPTLADLEAYDVVLTWSNYIYFDAVGMGNVLADYVDADGKVINLMFAMGTHGWQMQGRFMTEGYTAMDGTSLNFVTSCLGEYDANHPIMAGVTDVCDYYRLSGTYLTAGSTAVAMWSDGQIFVAAKDDRTVVSIDGYAGSARQWTGQMDLVVHNAIIWLIGPTDVPWIWEVPISGTVTAGSTDDIEIFFTSQYTDGTPMPLGTYSATLTIDNNDPVVGFQKIPVLMHIVEEYSAPVPDFAATQVIVGNSTVFTNLTDDEGIPPADEYIWDFGDGITMTVGTKDPVSHVYATFGTFTATLTACNVVDCLTVTHSVVVSPKVILLPLINKN